MEYDYIAYILSQFLKKLFDSRKFFIINTLKHIQNCTDKISIS